MDHIEKNIEIEKNKFVQKTIVNDNNEQFTFDNIQSKKVDSILNSVYSNNQNNFGSFNKNDMSHQYKSLSRKDKVSIIMSKISKEKQSIWSIRDYEDILKPIEEVPYNDKNNINSEQLSNNEKNNKLMMSSEEGPNKNLAYLSPPPPLNQETKVRLQRTEKTMMNFNLDDQAITASRKTKENLENIEEPRSKRNSDVKFSREYKAKGKGKAVKNDAKLEKENNKCNLCQIF